MTTSTTRRMAGVGLAAALVLVGCGASDPPASVATGPARVASVRPQPRRTTTTVRPATTTVAPTTTAAPPGPTTTTTRPAPRTTTTVRRTTTTTAPPPPPTTVAPPPPPPVTTAPAPVGHLSAATQNDMLRMVNAGRASGMTCGGVAYPPVPPLSLNGTLTKAADAHALDMATNNYFSHDGLDGSDPASRILAAGYHILTWAENIAAGQPTPASVISAWFDSTGHCVNFMQAGVNQIGFGEADNQASTYKRYWVADLGHPA